MNPIRPNKIEVLAAREGREVIKATHQATLSLRSGGLNTSGCVKELVAFSRRHRGHQTLTSFQLLN